MPPIALPMPEARPPMPEAKPPPLIAPPIPEAMSLAMPTPWPTMLPTSFMFMLDMDGIVEDIPGLAMLLFWLCTWAGSLGS